MVTKNGTEVSIAKKYGDFCPITLVQSLIGGKWKIIILYHLSKDKKRFNELHRLIPNISQGILTQQLRQLEHDGLVIRKIYKEIPPKVEYSLSTLGESFVPLLKQMIEWGAYYVDHR